MDLIPTSLPLAGHRVVQHLAAETFRDQKQWSVRPAIALGRYEFERSADSVADLLPPIAQVESDVGKTVVQQLDLERSVQAGSLVRVRRGLANTSVVVWEQEAVNEKCSRRIFGWGAPRIHGELLKLGIEISQATDSKYMSCHRKPPSQTWRTFLDHHPADLASMDIFTVPTATFRILYVFMVLRHDRREIVHFNVTEHIIVESRLVDREGLAQD